MIAFAIIIYHRQHVSFFIFFTQLIQPVEVIIFQKKWLQRACKILVFLIVPITHVVNAYADVTKKLLQFNAFEIVEGAGISELAQDTIFGLKSINVNETKTGGK